MQKKSDEPAFSGAVIGVVKPEGARRILDCGLGHLYGLINAGELDSYLDGRCRKITLSSIDAYIQRSLASNGSRKGRVPGRREPPDAVPSSDAA
jgi:hypothetical protein